MQASTRLRLLAALGPLLAFSCWITAALLFGNLMGENFSVDPVEQAHIAASRHLWTTVLSCSWLIGLVTSSAIAGFTLKTNRILASLTGLILLAFIVFVVVWGNR